MSSTTTKTQKPVEKKKPGRPPKRRINTFKLASVGVVSEPNCKEHMVELVYGNPMLFKKLFTFFKKCGINEITFDFYKDRVEIKSMDANEKYVIHATIRGHLLARYYCREDRITRTVNRTNIDQIFKSIDKNNPDIAFILHEKDCRSKLYIIINNKEMDAKFNYTVDLIREASVKHIQEKSSKDYPLKFQLLSKDFKKLISNVCNADAELVSFKKLEDGPVSITYKTDRKLSLVAEFNNPQKINLEFDETAGEILGIDIAVKHIKPFSDSNIGETIYIACDPYKDLNMRTDIDRQKFEREDGVVIEGTVCSVQVFIPVHRMQQL